MTHFRTTIRDAVINALMNNTSAGSMVFDSLIEPYDDSNPTDGNKQTFPVISVYTLEEDIGEIKGLWPNRQIEIIQTVEIEAIVKAKNGYQSALDALCQQIELLITYDLGLDEADKVTYRGTNIDLFDDGDKPFAVASIIYHVHYWKADNEATVDLATLDDLIRIYMDWDMASPDGQIDAQDRLENLNV